MHSLASSLVFMHVASAPLLGIDTSKGRGMQAARLQVKVKSSPLAPCCCTLRSEAEARQKIQIQMTV